MKPPCERIAAKPTWWVLYLIGLILIGLLGLVEASVPSGALRTLLEAILVILMLGLMVTWVMHNRVAIELERVSATKASKP